MDRESTQTDKYLGKLVYNYGGMMLGYVTSKDIPDKNGRERYKITWFSNEWGEETMVYVTKSIDAMMDNLKREIQDAG